MNKLKSYLNKPASASLASVFLILICIACACPRTEKNSNVKISNGSSPKNTTPTNRNLTNTSVDDGNTVYSDGNTEEEMIPPNGNNDSSSSFFVGNWYVSRPNAYGGVTLKINNDGTYFWKDGLTEETFNGSWEMDGGNLILKKGYKDVDWLVKPTDKSESAEDMIFISENGAGMASIFFRGKRRAE